MKSPMKKVTSVKLKGWDLDDDTTALVGARFRGASLRRRKLARRASAVTNKKSRKSPSAR